jgi:glycosyltransferase involved in cell wall biosynthesis
MRVFILGEGENRIKLGHAIATHHLEDRISLVGFVPNASQYLKAFDIFVLPSLKEGLPYTLIEAMHAKIPIISTRVGGVPDLIEHDVNGIIVPPKDSGTLAIALEKLIQNKEMRARFAKESGKKIATKFSFETMLRHTIALYLQERS